MNQIRERILGCLSMSAVGDVLGGITENLSFEQVMERSGKAVETDCLYQTGNGFKQKLAISKNTRDVLEQIDSFINRHSTNNMLNKQTDRLNNIVPLGIAASAGGCARSDLSDAMCVEEAAVHAVCAGLFNPGNLDQAVRDACVICVSPQSKVSVFAGAGAIAAGISQALLSYDVLSVYKACMYGAREGERYGKEHGNIKPGASVEARIRLAMNIVTNNEYEDISGSIEALLGSADSAIEAVPAAIGFFVGAHGDPIRSISSAATAGGNSRLIASLAGQLSGALCGINRCPRDLCSNVDHANALWLSGWSDKVLHSLLERYPATALSNA